MCQKTNEICPTTSAQDASVVTFLQTSQHFVRAGQAMNEGMANLKARLLGGWLGDRLLRDVVVSNVEPVDRQFRKIRVGASWLGEAPAGAGDKVQIYLPDVGARTYTPFDIGRGAEAFSLLFYLHGDTPGAAFARGIVVGQTLRVLGPGRSIPLESLALPVALFGDETSLGIACSVYALGGSVARSTAHLEVSSIESARAACAALGLSEEALIERDANDGHLEEVARRLSASTRDGGTIVLTGRASSIQKLRVLLRTGSRRSQSVKAYWADGKRGLD